MPFKLPAPLIRAGINAAFTVRKEVPREAKVLMLCPLNSSVPAYFADKYLRFRSQDIAENE